MPTLEASAQIICSGTQFDRRLAADQSLRSRIAGFSTISLGDLMSSRTEAGFAVPLFSRDSKGVPTWSYADLHSETYEGVFNRSPNHYRGFRELMITNRKVYGKPSAFTDYLVNELGVDGSAHDISYGVIVDLYQQLVGKPLRRGSVDPYLNDEDWFLIGDAFPEEKDVLTALSALRKRSGVQVIYGDKPKFTKFLKEGEARSADDCAVEFYKPVPSELVMAVIPLGQYEKKALGV